MFSKIDKELQGKFIAAIYCLVGKECWGVVAGEGTGSIISLDFGAKVSRDKPLKNPFLSDNQRRFESELSLFVKCAWRLNSENEIICSSTDPNNNEGPMVSGLNQLIGHKVEKINVSLPAYDLEIKFDNALYLYVFCGETNVNDNFANYTYFFYDKLVLNDACKTKQSFTVGSRSFIVHHQYNRHLPDSCDV